MTHLTGLTSLLALSLFAATAARAHSPGDIGTVDASLAPANLRYQTGAYFSGNDCGGNSVMTSGSGHSNAPGGVILSGAAGTEIARLLNCGERRNALASYRDAFQGKIGQSYPWLDPDNGVTGAIVATSRSQADGLTCTKFRAVTSLAVPSSNGTACREPDGNWDAR